MKEKWDPDKTWEALALELNSLRIVCRDAHLFADAVSHGKLHASTLEHIELFARRAKEIVLALEKAGETRRQKRMSDMIVPEGEQQHTVGNTTTVQFNTFGNKEVKGKVDTGATTSSLHATDIKVQGNQVTFSSDELSDKNITVDLAGQQDVSSADGGTQQRPMIKLDVEINGVPIKDAMFNLNDRSNMDTPILIGQNILKAGNFVVDMGGDKEQEPKSQEQQSSEPAMVRDDQKVIEAINTLRKQHITFEDLFEYLKTEAVNSIKE